MRSWAERYSGEFGDDDRASTTSPRSPARWPRCNGPSCTCGASRSTWQKVVDSNAFTFIHEVNADGVSHRYRAVDVPDLDDHWALVLGDCVHNLRSALDYLVYELVRANGGTPDDHAHAVSRCTRRPAGCACPAGSPTTRCSSSRKCSRTPTNDEGNRIHAIDRARSRCTGAASCRSSPAATGHIVPIGFRHVEPGAADRRGVDERPPARERQDRARLHVRSRRTSAKTRTSGAAASRARRSDRRDALRARSRRPCSIGDKLIPWVREQFLPRFEPFFG